MTRSPQLRRLHFLNALFAPLTGQDLYLAQQIDDAIATSLGDAEQRGPACGEPVEPLDPAFIAAAAKLFERLCATQPQHGFFHWDASEGDAGGTPLFTRAGLMQGLKQLAPFTESTLLVTNLRAAHCPPDRRWTERRQRNYDESLSLIRDLAAARSRRSASLNLLFL
ncbi:MAG: hypothetical protein WDM96_02370 [Lacunisphaera sp.]